MLTAAAALTGEKADEHAQRGMHLLDAALGKARDYQGQALVAARNWPRQPIST